MNLVNYDVRDRVAVVTIDNPPVNALGPGVREALEEAVRRATEDAAIDAIVVNGAGRTFVAGADINVFRTLTTPAQSVRRSEGIHASLTRLEDTGKPLVAAIHGHALGGGLELAMACHYRIATSDARVGQPEIHLGIIPGAGGTQRLPRLCGARLALELCTQGKPMPAPQARDAGIIDLVVAQGLVETAIEWARAKAASGERRKTREIAVPPADRAAGLLTCAEARHELTAPPQKARALAAVIDAIEAAMNLDFDAGSARERELFAECVVSTESRALIEQFFAEREAARRR